MSRSSQTITRITNAIVEGTATYVCNIDDMTGDEMVRNHSNHSETIHVTPQSPSRVLPFLYMFVTVLLSFISFPPVQASAEEHSSPEELYREVVQRWQQSNGRNWDPWLDFSTTLLERFQNAEPGNRLELVRAFEEGILAIERVTVAMGEGSDPERDTALSQLYFGYGRALSLLNATECLDLVFDPHTLLIGAETASKDNPSTHLCIENAENALRNAVTLEATNGDAEQLLQQITGVDTVHKRKPKEFVAELFDSFADKFDEKLNSLGYSVPKMIGESAQKLLSEFEKSGGNDTYQSALDAGCGTGLAGRYLRPLVSGPMIGVDASTKMLNIASKCTLQSGCGLDDSAQSKDAQETDEKLLYEGLFALDLEDITLDNTLHSPYVKDGIDTNNVQGFDLVVAADVLVYFGQLDNILQTFSSVSRPGAALVFSCERADEAEAPLGWRLLSSGRFAHTKKHAVEAAEKAGYQLVSYEEIVPRMERGEEVKGHLFGFVLEQQRNEKSEL